MIFLFTLGVGLPVIVAFNSTGAPSSASSLSKGTTTFGASGFCNSSFFGAGALTSNGAKCSGCMNDCVSIEGIGFTFNDVDVSSVPLGFVARTV